MLLGGFLEEGGLELCCCPLHVSLQGEALPGGLLDLCVQGPSISVGTWDVLPEDLVNSAKCHRLGFGQVGSGWGVSCPFLGQAGPVVLKCLTGHLPAGAALLGTVAWSLSHQDFE